MNSIISITSEVVTTSGDSGGGWGVWIFLAIFFGIIGVLVIVAVIGSKKDKNEKLIENSKRKKIRVSAETNRIIIFISLNEAFKNLEKELKDFKPSIGIKSLGDINKEYGNIVKSILQSSEFKEVCYSEDYSNEMKPIIKELNSNKPSTWSKEATFALGLVNAKVKSLIKNTENKKDIAAGKKKKWK